MSRYEVVYSTDAAWCPRCRRSPCACAAAAKPAGPLQGTAKLRLEKSGRGGKVVTVVFNLVAAPAQFRDLLRDLQKACGTGGTAKDDRIEIQGDHRDRVEERLRALGFQVKRAGG